MDIELSSLKEFEDYYRSLPPKEYIDEEIIVNNSLRIDKFKQISVLTDESSYGKTWSFILIPESNHTCNHCGKGWDLSNIKDYEIYNSSKHYHNICLKSIINREHLSNFLYSFYEVGIIPLSITRLENKYWPESYKDKHYYNDWYLFETYLGTFEIGWRKRVISVKIQEKYNVDFSKLVDNDVTSSFNSFHAYSYNKLEEYLKNIKSELIKERLK